MRAVRLVAGEHALVFQLLAPPLELWILVVVLLEDLHGLDQLGELPVVDVGPVSCESLR